MKEDAKERAEKYIANSIIAIKSARRFKVNPVEIGQTNVDRVIDAAERYIVDAQFYLKEDKPVTALVSISYSEGLLDGLQILKLIPAIWKPGEPFEV